MTIDFHTHVLPQMDDGSRSVEESMAMLLALKAQGVDVVIATPHYYADQECPDSFFQRRAVAIQKLWEHLDKSNQVVSTIHMGAEVAYYDSISQMEALHSFCIQGTSYLLLEMPFRCWSDHVLAEVQTIVQRGIVPIIAHLERYECFHRPREIEKLISLGAKIQISCGAFQKMSDLFWIKKWLRKGYIHCLGSDCHNITTRKPNFAGVLQKCGSTAFLTMKINT